jgi:hypothetical protein
MHLDVGTVANDLWEKTPLTAEDLKKIKLFLDKIKILKQQGLTGFGIVASYLRRRVQPLKARKHYGFEYVGAEDPSRMVPTQELTEEEVLERIRKVFKGVSVIPHRVDEYTAANPPLAISLLLVQKYASSLFSLLKLIGCGSGYLQDWGGILMTCPRCLWKTTLVGLEKAKTRGLLLERAGLVLQLSFWGFP